jgi:hypothetical protein
MPKVRDLVNAVLADQEKEIAQALKRTALNPKTVLQVLDLAAKLNREIGPGSEGGGWPSVVILGRDATIERYRKAAAPARSGRKDIE